MLDREGVRSSPAKAQAVLEVSEPENRTELQSFLGLGKLLSQIYSKHVNTGQSFEPVTIQGHTLVLE